MKRFKISERKLKPNLIVNILLIFILVNISHGELDGTESEKIEIVPPFETENYDPTILLNKKSHVILNKCRREVFTDKIWILPDWLRGPKSDLKSKHLNHTNNFGGALFKFKFQTRKLNCKDENKENFKLYGINRSDVEKTRNSSLELSWQYGGYLDYFTPFGRFRMNDYFLNPQSFCVSEISEKSVSLEVCIPQVKVRKCCPHGTVVKFSLNSTSEFPDCVEIFGDDWTPDFYKDTRHVDVDSDFNGDNNSENHFHGFNVSFVSEYYNPVCDVYDKFTPNRRAVAPYLADIRVLEDGSVLTRPNGNHDWDKPKIYGKKYIDDFCIDGFIDSDQIPQDHEGPIHFEQKKANQIILFCHFPRNEIDQSHFYSSLYFALFLFSSIVLGLIAVCYAIIWRRQNIHGWTTLGFSTSMCMWFVFSAVTHGAGLFQGNSWVISLGGTFCILNGILWHFFYVATFSWMSILSFDLWSSICSITPKGKGIRDYGRFAIYCSIGFGIPVIVVVTSLIIEYDYDIFDDSVVRPMYGQEICSLDKSALLSYAILISVILFALNLFFVGSTIVFLCKYMKAKNSFTLKTEVKLFGKFFILMGFTWIFEMISGNQEVTWYWAIFDVYNIIQAVGLFWIFVCKPDIFEQLCQECKFFKVFKTLLKPRDETTQTMATEKSQVFSQAYKAATAKQSESTTNLTAEDPFDPPILNKNHHSNSYRPGYELNEMT